jgi:diguanylate cyclase (GGDEF)-like protein
MEPEMSEEVATRLLAFIDRTPDLVGVCDELGRLLYLNEAARKHLGVADATGLTTADFFAPEAFASYYDEVRPTLVRTGVWTGELPIRAQGGASIPMLFSVVAGVAPGAEVTGLVAYGRPLPYAVPDTEAAPTFLHDAAELVDRAVVTQWVAASLEHSARSGRRVALVYAEIRGLRTLLERYGDFVADGVIRAVARRMTTTVRMSDIVARIGRNAFIVAFTDVRDVTQALRLTHLLKDTLEHESIWTAAGHMSITLGVGLSVADPGEGAGEAMRRAEVAEITAKGATRPAVAVADKRDDSPIATYESLRVAVMNGDVRTFVRPVVDRQGRVVAYDAFPRWVSAEGGTLESQALYDLAGRAGVGPAMSLRILREGAAFVMTSPSAHPLGVVAEISEALVRDAYAEQYLWEIADALALPLREISLLIDQRLVVRHVISDATLRSLREAGLRLVATNIDERTDLDALHAEYHFVDMRLDDDVLPRALGDPSTHAQVQRLTTRSHELGIRIHAAGVQTAAEDDIGRALLVDSATGEFYGSAIAAETVG